MALSKDQTQKVIIAVIGVVIIYYVCFSMIIGPAGVTIEKSKVDQEKKLKEIAAAESKIKGVIAGEEQQKKNEAFVSYVETLIPNEPPQTYYPPDISKKFSLLETPISLPIVSSLPGGAGNLGQYFSRNGWVYTIQGIAYHDLGRVIATIENNNPLWEFADIDISAAPGSEEKHNVRLIMGTLNKVEGN